jgi:hypothetical protein
MDRTLQKTLPNKAAGLQPDRINPSDFTTHPQNCFHA